MSNCQVCGLGLVKSEEVDGVCCKCKNNLSDEKVKSIHEANITRHKGILITTETMCPDLKIEKRLTILTSECVFGMNVFRDFFAGVTDIIGGRSKTTQKIFRDARQIVLDDLRQQAYEINANAVIAVSIQYSQLPGKGGAMLMVAGTGTAVALKAE